MRQQPLLPPLPHRDEDLERSMANFHREGGAHAVFLKITEREA